MVNSGISTLDWMVVGVFLSMVIGLAMWVKFRQRGTEDFFLAGRSMGWFVVMLSTFATLFSTISFVSDPGEAYKNGLMMFLLMPAALLFYPLAIALFLRFYLLSRIFTIYEYLERRYNTILRLYGSLVYSIGRILYGGTVFYAASKVFYSLAGWNPMFTIVVIGAFTVAYCATGGMKAVMITDVIQGIIVIVGISAICFKVLQVTGFDLRTIYDYAAENDHGFELLTKHKFYRFDLHDRFSVWVLLWSAIYSPISYVSSDQSLIQRLMAAKSYKDAKRGIYGNLIISLPVVALLWIIGIGLYYFYNQGGGQLPHNLHPDLVMGYFIQTELPTPLPGLITAALLAALMSTIDSTVNCVANVVHNDWVIRFGLIRRGSKYEMPFCRILTVLAGCCCVSLAVLLVLAEKGVATSVFEVVKIVGIMAGGPIVLAFLFGVLSTRVSGKAMFVSLLAGWAVNAVMPYLVYYSVPEDQRISFMWVNVPGIAITAVLTIALSRFWPSRKDLTNLTLWTLKKQDGMV